MITLRSISTSADVLVLITIESTPGRLPFLLTATQPLPEVKKPYPPNVCKSLAPFRTSKPPIDNDSGHWQDLFGLSRTQQGFTPSAPVPVHPGPPPPAPLPPCLVPPCQMLTIAATILHSPYKTDCSMYSGMRVQLV